MRRPRKKSRDRSVWSVEELMTTESSWPMEVGLWIPDASFKAVPPNAMAKAQDTVESWYVLSYGTKMEIPLMAAIVESVAMRGFCTAALTGDKGLEDDQLVNYYHKLTKTRFVTLSTQESLDGLFFLECDIDHVGMTAFNKVPVFDFILVMKEVK